MGYKVAGSFSIGGYMTLRSVLAGGALILAMATGLQAHHSVASAYFMDQSRSIEGSVVEIVLRNPHASVSIETRDNEGKMIRWTADWISLSNLNSAGVNAYTLAVGETVRITGAPSRAENEHHLLMTEIVRPADGWNWSGVIVKPAAPTIVATR